MLLQVIRKFSRWKKRGRQLSLKDIVGKFDEIISKHKWYGIRILSVTS